MRVIGKPYLHFGIEVDRPNEVLFQLRQADDSVVATMHLSKERTFRLVGAVRKHIEISSWHQPGTRRPNRLGLEAYEDDGDGRLILESKWATNRMFPDYLIGIAPMESIPDTIDHYGRTSMAGMNMILDDLVRLLNSDIKHTTLADEKNHVDPRLAKLIQDMRRLDEKIKAAPC
jgi:hypothetical protein